MQILHLFLELFSLFENELVEESKKEKAPKG
jgi:hypothetical protein